MPSHEYDAKKATLTQALAKADEEVVWTSSLNPNVVAILSLFFGALGVHDFYCGKIGHGVLKLIFTLTVVLSFISISWNLMDLYGIGEGSYTDSKGLHLDAIGWPKVAVFLLILPSIAFVAFLLFVILPIAGYLL